MTGVVCVARLGLGVHLVHAAADEALDGVESVFRIHDALALRNLQRYASYAKGVIISRGQHAAGRVSDSRRECFWNPPLIRGGAAAAR